MSTKRNGGAAKKASKSAGGETSYNKVSSAAAAATSTTTTSAVEGSKYQPKGLRAITQDVLHLIQANPLSSYTSVPETLMQNMLRLAEDPSFSEEEKRKMTNDALNVRRRAYDVMNVLIALGLLEKDSEKNLKLLGHPLEPDEKSDENPNEKSRPVEKSADVAESDEFDENLVSERIAKKRSHLAGLLVHQLMLYQLAVRNEGEQTHKSSSSAAVSTQQQQSTNDQHTIRLPFVVVSADKSSQCDLISSEDGSSITLTFSKGPFEVHDDLEVLERMNLLADIQADTIRKLVPKELFPLLPDFLQAKFLHEGQGIYDNGDDSESSSSEVKRHKGE